MTIVPLVVKYVQTLYHVIPAKKDMFWTQTQPHVLYKTVEMVNSTITIQQYKLVKTVLEIVRPAMIQ